MRRRSRISVKMKKVFENKLYRVYEIPDNGENAHQFKYFIKEGSCTPKAPAKLIGREGYTEYSNGLNYIKDLAEETIRDSFIVK